MAIKGLRDFERALERLRAAAARVPGALDDIGPVSVAEFLESVADLGPTATYGLVRRFLQEHASPVLDPTEFLHFICDQYDRVPGEVQNVA